MREVFIAAIPVSFIAGCFAAYFFAPAVLYSICAIAVLTAIALFARRNKRIVLICVCGVALLLGVVRVTLPERHIESTITDQYPDKVTLTGVITGDIEHKRAYSRYVIALKKINGNAPQKKSAVLVYEPYPTKCVPGEAVSLRARMQEPENFISATGRVFEYKKYLRQFNIRATTFVEKSGCTGERKQPAVFARLRERLVSAMHTFLPAEEASLLGGLLLGLRGAMSAELLEAFRITGLIHIIVLSGYNVTLVAETIRRVLARTPKSVSFTASLIAIIGFVLLAGAQTAAIRAGSMATIALIARATRREYDGIRALLIVAVLMVLYNPDQVLFSVSFHLSFIATLGLLLLAPIIEHRLRRIPEKYELRGIIAATLATQLFLLPYLAYAIGEVSVIGILANMLIIPIIPIAMLFGSAVSIIALIPLPLATFLSPLAFLPLHTIILLAESLARIPHASLPLPEISPVLTALTLAGMTYIGHKTLQKQKEAKKEK